MDGKNTTTLADYKDELHKCSKCGLCQGVCPVYLETGNECSVSRGLFVMLKGVIEGKLNLNKNINKYLDLCLKCNKCSDFCPSDIDIVDIITQAKYEYFKNSIEGKIYKILESKYIFDSGLNFISALLKLFYPQKKSKTFETKAVYFGGCASKYNPKVNNYVTKLLNDMKIEVLQSNFKCCGMPFFSTGNLDRFCEVVKENIKKIPDNVDCIIFDCASCKQMWTNYSKYIEDSELKEKLSKIKLKSIYELISENNIKFTAKKHQTLTYHIPCHEEHSTCIEKIIKNIENTEYKELEDKSQCCGFASYEHPLTLQTLLPIINKKRAMVKNSGAEYVLTTCEGCLINLKIMLTFSKQKAQKLITFLMQNCTKIQS